LVNFGPAKVSRWKFSDPSLDSEELTLEIWSVKEREIVKEITAKAELPNVYVLQEKIEKFLRNRGVEICKQSIPKTKMVLESDK
jgi:hypothetical protein